MGPRLVAWKRPLIKQSTPAPQNQLQWGHSACAGVENAGGGLGGRELSRPRVHLCHPNPSAELVASGADPLDLDRDDLGRGPLRWRGLVRLASIRDDKFSRHRCLLSRRASSGPSDAQQPQHGPGVAFCQAQHPNNQKLWLMGARVFPPFLPRLRGVAGQAIRDAVLDCPCDGGSPHPLRRRGPGLDGPVRRRVRIRAPVPPRREALRARAALRRPGGAARRAATPPLSRRARTARVYGHPPRARRPRGRAEG